VLLRCNSDVSFSVLGYLNRAKISWGWAIGGAAPAPSKYAPGWGATDEAILNLYPKPKTVCGLNVALEKIWDSVMQVQLTKVSRVLPIVWQEYVNGDRRHSKYCSLLKKVFTFMAFGLS